MKKKEFIFDATLIGQWLGFLAIVMFMFKVLDVIDVSWFIVFAPIWFPGIMVVLAVVVLSLAGWVNKAFYLAKKVKKCNKCDDGFKEE